MPLKFSGKLYWSPCNFEKTQVPLLRMTEQLQILYPRLECTSRDLKGLWIASKSVFSLFGRKPSLGAPDQQLWKHISTRWSKEVNKQCNLIAILGPVLYLAVFHLNVIICFARHKAYFIIFAYQPPARSANSWAKAINLRGLNRIPSSSKLTLVMPIPCP